MTPQQAEAFCPAPDGWGWRQQTDDHGMTLPQATAYKTRESQSDTIRYVSIHQSRPGGRCLVSVSDDTTQGSTWCSDEHLPLSVNRLCNFIGGDHLSWRDRMTYRVLKSKTLLGACFCYIPVEGNEICLEYIGQALQLWPTPSGSLMLLRPTLSEGRVDGLLHGANEGRRVGTHMKLAGTISEELLGAETLDFSGFSMAIADAFILDMMPGGEVVAIGKSTR